MPCPNRVSFRELLGRILTHRFQQSVACLRVVLLDDDQGLVSER